MPLYINSQQKLKALEITNFATEKALQTLIEHNLQAVFNCRFVATEFPTGPQHAGRIDTLGISEDNNPVIIEYKKKESSELITQSLYYLAWIMDHRGDYEVIARKTLGNDIVVDWSDVRVICIAPKYSKFDLYAVKTMGANIELWTYRLYTNDSLYLEEIHSTDDLPSEELSEPGKNPVMVSAGKKAAITRATGSYTFEEHIKGKPEKMREIALAVQEYMLGLDPAIEESPKKLYVAYRMSQNIVCMEIQTQQVYLYIKLNPKEFAPLPSIARDTTSIGHYGTGDLEVSLKNLADLEVVKPFLEKAYKKIGG